MTVNPAHYTKLPKFIERALEVGEACRKYGSPPADVGKMLIYSANNFSKQPEEFKKMSQLPCFNLVGFSLDENVENKKIFESYKAVIDHVGFTFPFDEFMIEYEVMNQATKNCSVRLFLYVYRMTMNKFTLSQVALIDETYPLIDFLNVIVEYKDGQFFHHADKNFVINDDEKTTRTIDQTWLSCEFIISQLIGLLATRGIVQERMEAPKKINEKRARKGRVQIPTVILIKIGHYYDRNGNQHEYNERNSPRVHWRRGHVRGVRFGKGREQIRQQYIFPCLVNYVEGEEKPEHRTRVLVN